jgi:HJR/Mrr/RecB family endonuclease
MEERNREMRNQTAERGGTLERAGAIREVGDIRGLTLAQLGGFVNQLFKKKGFAFKDYKFVEKDKYVDLWLEHEAQTWHIRCSTAERVSAGAVESLLQEMKREGITKGIVVTSTEFTSSATKSAKDKPVVLIDGITLYDISR